MLKMEGEREYGLPRAELFAKLTDLQFLASCVPDVSAVKSVQPNAATMTVRPSFAFVRGSLDLTIEKLEETAPSQARLLFKNKGIGSSADVEAGFQLEESGPASTRVRWVGELKSLGGLLKLVPRGLIQGAAQKIVNDLLDGIEKRLRA